MKVSFSISQVIDVNWWFENAVFWPKYSCFPSLSLRVLTGINKFNLWLTALWVITEIKYLHLLQQLDKHSSLLNINYWRNSHQKQFHNLHNMQKYAEIQFHKPYKIAQEWRHYHKNLTRLLQNRSFYNLSVTRLSAGENTFKIALEWVRVLSNYSSARWG